MVLSDLKEVWSEEPGWWSYCWPPEHLEHLAPEHVSEVLPGDQLGEAGVAGVAGVAGEDDVLVPLDLAVLHWCNQN